VIGPNRAYEIIETIQYLRVPSGLLREAKDWYSAMKKAPKTRICHFET
jgi:hypothetical protein